MFKENVVKDKRLNTLSYYTHQTNLSPLLLFRFIHKFSENILLIILKFSYYHPIITNPGIMYENSRIELRQWFVLLCAIKYYF